MSTFTIGRFIYKEHKETFGQRLKRMRKAKGLTQTELAKKMGVSHVSISMYENDIEHPKVVSLEWLCQALGVTATELLGF